MCGLRLNCFVLCAIVLLGGCARNAVTSASSASEAQSRPAQTQAALPDDAASEAVSLLGQPLRAPPLSDQVRIKRERELLEAQSQYDRDPHDEQAIIWLGRRQAYLGRYREAILTFSNGLAIHPESYRLLRHRGHRYITIRKFDAALPDLERAAELIANVPDEIEPDGQPNRLNVPTSTSHTNIYYHLGLVRYLKGDYAVAEQAYQQCMAFSGNDDMRCAAAYWRYLSLRRQQKNDDAQRVLNLIAAQMNIIENSSYHRLLLVFKGELAPDKAQGESGEDPSIDAATIGYGLGTWDLINGRRGAAMQRFRSVIASTNWAAFGHIAAEAELARHVQN